MKLHSLSCAALVCLGLITPPSGVGAASFLSEWSWVEPATTTGRSVRDVEFDGDRFLACGAGRTLWTSSDGVSWSALEGAAPVEFFDLTSAGGVFYGVGHAQKEVLPGIEFTVAEVWRSEDGMSWSSVYQFESSTQFKRIKYLNGPFFLGGSPGTQIGLSTNGVDWELKQLNPGGGAAFMDAAGDGSLLVTGGQFGLLYVSADAGDTWDDRSFSDFLITINVAEYFAGRFVIAGNRLNVPLVYTSTDGQDWTPVTIPIAANRIESAATYSGRLYLRAGNQFLHTANLIDWSVATAPVHWSYRAFAVAATGLSSVGDRGCFVHSSDLVDWSGPDRFDYHFWEAVEFQNHCVAVGGWSGRSDPGVAAYSADSDEWNYVELPTTNVLEGLAASQDVLVASGAAGTVVITTNLVDWEVVNMGTTSELPSVAWCGDRFLVGGQNGTLFSSFDARDWTPLSVGTSDYVACIAHGKGRTVLGAGTNIFSSSDFINWQRVDNPIGGSFFELVFGNGRFVGVSPLGAWWSYDGLTWHEIDWNGINAAKLYFRLGQFITENLGRLWVSDAGLQWEVADYEGPPDLQGLAVAGSRLVQVGYSAMIIHSRPFHLPQLEGADLVPIDQFGFQFDAVGGHGYRVQTSSNLVEWTTEGIVHPSDGQHQIVRPIGDGERGLYFRVLPY